MGYDVHRLVSGRRLILGGIPISWDKGLLGHSDADVVTHAVCDALLGAAGLGDIGLHFPDSDSAWAGIDSLELLQRVRSMIEGRWRVVNLDVSVLAQAPKLAPYREAMQARLAEVLGIPKAQVNIKATTTEGLGPIGREEGIAAQCVVLLQQAAGTAQV
jgi:2-C-methyl-D-erythritol 2,4-cyclodiphosphate synthase